MIKDLKISIIFLSLIISSQSLVCSTYEKENIRFYHQSFLLYARPQLKMILVESRQIFDLVFHKESSSILKDLETITEYSRAIKDKCKEDPLTCKELIQKSTMKLIEFNEYFKIFSPYEKENGPDIWPISHKLNQLSDLIQFEFKHISFLINSGRTIEEKKLVKIEQSSKQFMYYMIYSLLTNSDHYEVGKAAYLFYKDFYIKAKEIEDDIKNRNFTSEKSETAIYHMINSLNISWNQFHNLININKKHFEKKVLNQSEIIQKRFNNVLKIILKPLYIKEAKK